MRDAFHVLPLQAQVGHASGGSAGMRLLEKIHETFETVFFVQRTKRSGMIGGQFVSLVVAGCMTDRTPPCMEEALSFHSCDRVRCLQREVVFLQRKQIVAEGCRDLLFFNA